jgi:hypothetical protein
MLLPHKGKEDKEEDEIGSHYSTVTSSNSFFLVFIGRAKGLDLLQGPSRVMRR